MMKFELKSDYQPSGDQPQAIARLTQGLLAQKKHQVLLGVTGSGKTFTMANVIQNIQKPTLLISHNKTLAAQLYQELRDFFPKNAVSYFVSYYDFYQPEAYIPQTDTYIEKETEINEEIDKLRLAATTNLLTRKDTIVVASVSCIYNLGSPIEYGRFILELREGMKVESKQILSRLIDLQYSRNDYGFRRGTFRVKGDTIDIFPAYVDYCVRLDFLDNKLQKISFLDPLTGKNLPSTVHLPSSVSNSTVIYPAKHYMTNPQTYHDVFAQIRKDLQLRVNELTSLGKVLEAQRLKQRTEYDLEMIQELGFVNGIENYSRYFDGRNVGDPPYTLLDYFPKGHLLIIDESHITIPQIRGMYNGDHSRKETLVNYGFRLPSALDNRPLKYDEFMRRVNETIYLSATPSAYEISLAKGESRTNADDGVVEQLIRPTGLVDPTITIHPTSGQIDHLVSQIRHRVSKAERVLVTTLTKRMAEELSLFLEEQQIKVHYLHSDIQTLERSDILESLRLGQYDVVVGINLLREGLDLPEVSLVAILDSDKEGFLRSETSLIQTMGRAARHLDAEVIMYADKVTGSMQRAIAEVERRRKIQLAFNQKHRISPQPVIKPVRRRLIEKDENEKNLIVNRELGQIDFNQLLPEDKKKLASKFTKLMKLAAKETDFEAAAKYRDLVKKLNSEFFPRQ
ncbi:excinuclease ABC subunit UvrB [Candidatus Gottesmanbacteria bacterium]|nr:excinuclease ABC subunit UvrB [Candidatus Gottesmanbacteria bacterium]